MSQIKVPYLNVEFYFIFSPKKKKKKKKKTQKQKKQSTLIVKFNIWRFLGMTSVGCEVVLEAEVQSHFPVNN
ncbi:hypothetical protein ACN38_g4039 [Penicillium nordicum]|uniref:Uncharacterized protein n=1 Tax=Penicillium nordicum TaxID=229535 RepID=A0A0N0RZA2_9EURO|nr:hypothetical protein ACN38_g4039 [Penicillium nordicum]